MSDENLIFNRDAFADEGMAGYLAVPSDPGVFLYLDKRADLGVIANLAAVEVDELREFDVVA